MDIILVYYLLGKFIANTIISYSDRKTKDSILEKPECDYKEITKDIKDESIKNFRNILKNNFKEEDLKLFYHNLNTLKVVYKHIFNDPSDIGRCLAYYNNKANKIVIDTKSDYEDIINHELLHVASSCYIDKKIYSGFSQCYNEKLLFFALGAGINEGYTELLNTRYFNGGTSYLLETEIMTLVEKVVGKEIMEKLYFSADLSGLINELTKYETKDNIIKFVKNMDTVVYEEIKNKVLYQTIPDEIICFLYSISVNKLNKSNIPNEEYKNILNKLRFNLELIELIFLSKDYKPMSKDDIDNLSLEKIKKLRNVNIMYFY